MIAVKSYPYIKQVFTFTPSTLETVKSVSLNKIN